MSRPRIDLKDPIYAAILAFLVPGLGHFYQRRIFKGCLYFICILGTFFTGMRIGHGQVVYFKWDSSETRTYAYLCQFWTGLPALPALLQSGELRLRSPESFDSNFLPEPVSAPFTGRLSETGHDGVDGQITGQIQLKPQQPDEPRSWIGILTGTLQTADGAFPIKGEVSSGGRVGAIEAAVAPSPRRRLRGPFKGDVEGPAGNVSGNLDGSIPRSLWDSYEAPLQDPRVNAYTDESDLDHAHKMLGSRFELGVVYTMIAGLLNILAIYDALEGPAYDDEDEEKSGTPPPPTPPAA